MLLDEIGPRRWSAAIAAVAALMAASSQAVRPLATPTTPQDGVILACWWLAAALSMWFGISVGLWALAIRTRRPNLLKLLSRFAMPGARKLAEGTFAVTLMVSSAACSVGAASQAPTLSLVASGVTADTGGTTDGLETSTSTTARASSTTTAQPEPTTVVDEMISDDSAAQADRSYEVTAGDSLWSIAEAEVAHELGIEPTSAQIAQYWKELVDLNRHSILSGDPDLIYPGEVVELSPSIADIESNIAE